MVSCTWYDPVSRDQILRRKRGEGNNNFPCSGGREQDWQPYPVDPYSKCDEQTYSHISLCGVMGSRKCRGRPCILPAIFCFFLHPIKDRLQFCSTFFSTFFSATEMANGKTRKTSTKMWKFRGRKKRRAKLQAALYGMEKKTKIAGSIPGQPRHFLLPITPHKEMCEYVCSSHLE